MYNWKYLNVSGEDFSGWQKRKEISFESCDASDPGILTIKGNVIQTSGSIL